jgi:aminoglycoside phosphotransferase (APT) family kinase protein
VSVTPAEARLAAFKGSLEGFLAGTVEAETVSIEEARPLSGGGIQENWLIDARVSGGPWAGRQELVLRTDAPSGLAVSLTRAQEFRLLQAARAAGVTVPEPLWLCEDAGVLGKPFYLMRRLAGSSLRCRKAVRPCTRYSATGAIWTPSTGPGRPWNGACAGASSTRRRPAGSCWRTRTSEPATTWSTSTA